MEAKIDFAQQRANRAHFDQNLKNGPKEQKDPPPKPVGGAPAETEEKKKKQKTKKTTDEVEVDAAPAQGAKGGGKGKGEPEAKPAGGGGPPPGKAGAGGAFTPRTQEIISVAKMTPAAKAKHPCVFYAYKACRATPCQFLHDDANLFTRDLRPNLWPIEMAPGSQELLPWFQLEAQLPPF